jgi:hypothetical protein
VIKLSNNIKDNIKINLFLYLISLLNKIKLLTPKILLLPSNNKLILNKINSINGNLLSILIYNKKLLKIKLHNLESI